MRIYKEIELRNFEAWSGAEDTMETLRKLDNIVGGDVFGTLEACIDDMDMGMEETELNDFLWFETDTIAEWLGYGSWEALERMANEDEEDEEELKYEVGDFIVMTNGIEAEIIQIDIFDSTYPYHVRHLNENNETEDEWIRADEIDE